MTSESPNALQFALPRRYAALRALALVLLCAALTAGFLAHVWRGPTKADVAPDALACNPVVEKCA
jgi:hypothetical protein